MEIDHETLYLTQEALNQFLLEGEKRRLVLVGQREQLVDEANAKGICGDTPRSFIEQVQRQILEDLDSSLRRSTEDLFNQFPERLRIYARMEAITRCISFWRKLAYEPNQRVNHAPEWIRDLADQRMAHWMQTYQAISSRSKGKTYL